MEFVDKNKGKERAHNLLTGYLNRCLSCEIYPADLYEAMKTDVEPDIKLNPKKKFTYNLLLEWILDESHIEGDCMNNGEGYCCYCMRRIKVGEIHSTLEHLIPKAVTESADYNKYFRLKSSLECDKKVMVLKTDFYKIYHKKAMPYPHNAAYENLVGSCDGSLPRGSLNHKCCNLRRGDTFIPPLMFMPNIHSEIEYKKNGRIIWNNKNIDKRERCSIIQDVLCLNNEILRMIRLIWRYLSENGMDCDLDEINRRKIIDSLRPNCIGDDQDVIQNFMQDNYWDLLDEYRYFNDPTRFT